MIVMMEKFVLKSKGIHTNKVLNIQHKSFRDLPKLNVHLDNNNDQSMLCVTNTASVSSVVCF